jgi:phage tail sheath gpL-like
MTTKATLHIELAEGVDPFGHNTTRSKRTIFKEFAKLLRRVVGGGVVSRGSTRPTAIAGLVQASAIVTCAAVANADTVTINGQALTATQANASGTVTCASVSAADTATINGVVFTAVNGGTPTSAQFDMSGSDTACAASLVAAINASIDPLLSGVVTAANAAGVVTVRAVTAGTAGNSLTLATSNNTRLAKSGTVLANGAAIANNQFDFVGTNTQTGAALAAAVNASSTAILSGVVEATNAAGAVTIKAKVKGKVGNSITIATGNGTRLAITGSLSRLAGGTQTAYTF